MYHDNKYGALVKPAQNKKRSELLSLPRLPRFGFLTPGVSASSIGWFGQLLARNSGTANAFSNVMEMAEPLRTLFTIAGRKHAMHVPPWCRTLG